MVPFLLKPCKQFYKVDIRDFKEYTTTSTRSLISKIWHVDIRKTSSSPYLICRIETFRREQNDNNMEQSELGLWSKLAMINDDVTLLLDNYGNPVEVINREELGKKAKATFVSIRESFDGEIIDKLLVDVDAVYNDASLLLFELNAYNQFGLLTPCLYNNDFNTISRDKRLNLREVAYKTDIKECFTLKDADEGFIHFDMVGIAKNVEENLQKIDTCCGAFTFDTKNFSMHKANVDITYSTPDYKKTLSYKLQALSDKDMEYLGY